MVKGPHKSVSVPNRTYQAAARAELKKMAQHIGFTGHRLGEFEIVIAELTSNLSKHATAGGEILAAAVNEKENEGVEVICIDGGPGIAFPVRAMQDGVSSVGTLGQGLGAIRRLSDEFDVYTLKNWGTIIVCRLYIKRLEHYQPPRDKDIRTLLVAKPGETECGDNYHYSMTRNVLRLILADGLGHGPDAADASKKVVDTFLADVRLNPAEQLRQIHTSVRKTRGAVVGIANIDLANRQIMFCGVGNITMKICTTTKVRNCMSYNGIVGHTIPTVLNNHTFVWDRSEVVIMHSDGITARWDISRYPGIFQHDGSVLAAALYKDYSRKNDDVSIAIVRKNPTVYDDRSNTI